ncbi:ATP-binding protein [Streptomyces sp. NPDC004129]|uniref:ATP-binding protein n=1 Tax=Streptomyces sp. NPDC004533 TaxID=3154278 RepID=UPI00339DBCBB
MTSLDFHRPHAERPSSAPFEGEVPGFWKDAPSVRPDEEGSWRNAVRDDGAASIRTFSCADCDLAFDWHLHLHVPPAPAEVSRVRRTVRMALFSWGCPSSAIDDSVLLASELVGNAVRYGPDTWITVNLLHVGDRLLLEVTDGSSVRPAVQQTDPADEQGRGMYLVQAIASAWGSRREALGGKTTWCTLALDGRIDATSAR